MAEIESALAKAAAPVPAEAPAAADTNTPAVAAARAELVPLGVIAKQKTNNKKARNLPSLPGFEPHFY